MAIAGFVEHMDRSLSVPVEMGAVAEARPGTLHGVEPGRVTIAAGLAVAEVGK